MGIFDVNEKEQRENVKKMMQRNKNERILSLYDSLNFFKTEPLKNYIQYCRYPSTAGYLAYINNGWCVTFFNNEMIRYKTDEIVPICQKRIISSPRSLVQYLIDMEKESNVFFSTDQYHLFEEMKKLPLTFKSENYEKVDFDLELFKQPILSDGRLDFYLKDDLNTLNIDLKLLRPGRQLKLFFHDDKLYIKDKETNTTFDLVAINNQILSDNEKEYIEKLDLVLSNRVFQGVINGKNTFIGSVIVPGYEFSLINKIEAVKINRNF